jgi:Cu(I)/Ag(I) efflux system membrane fusion protein
VGSARQRLSYWDISAAQLEELERTRAPLRALTLYSPASGIVNAKYAVQGMRVSPADILYDIIDLSSIWVLADLYEIHLPMVKLGTPALVSLPYHPGRQWRGKVSFLEPVLDAQTRTIKARLDFPNPGGMLKPAMYVDVEFQGSAGRGVAVPESAVMTTGERALVFVTRKTHHFEPRVVQLGVQAKGFYEIKAGVKAGERVVTGANFLLDSESRLKAAIAGQ